MRATPGEFLRAGDGERARAKLHPPEPAKARPDIRGRAKPWRDAKERWALLRKMSDLPGIVRSKSASRARLGNKTRVMSGDRRTATTQPLDFREMTARGGDIMIVPDVDEEMNEAAPLVAAAQPATPAFVFATAGKDVDMADRKGRARGGKGAAGKQIGKLAGPRAGDGKGARAKLPTMQGGGIATVPDVDDDMVEAGPPTGPPANAVPFERKIPPRGNPVKLRTGPRPLPAKDGRQRQLGEARARNEARRNMAAVVRELGVVLPRRWPKQVAPPVYPRQSRRDTLDQFAATGRGRKAMRLSDVREIPFAPFDPSSGYARRGARRRKAPHVSDKSMAALLRRPSDEATERRARAELDRIFAEMDALAASAPLKQTVRELRTAFADGVASIRQAAGPFLSLDALHAYTQTARGRAEDLRTLLLGTAVQSARGLGVLAGAGGRGARAAGDRGLAAAASAVGAIDGGVRKTRSLAVAAGERSAKIGRAAAGVAAAGAHRGAEITLAASRASLASARFGLDAFKKLAGGVARDLRGRMQREAVEQAVAAAPRAPAPAVEVEDRAEAPIAPGASGRRRRTGERALGANLSMVRNKSQKWIRENLTRAAQDLGHELFVYWNEPHRLPRDRRNEITRLLAEQQLPTDIQQLPSFAGVLYPSEGPRRSTRTSRPPARLSNTLQLPDTITKTDADERLMESPDLRYIKSLRRKASFASGRKRAGQPLAVRRALRAPYPVRAPARARK